MTDNVPVQDIRSDPGFNQPNSISCVSFPGLCFYFGVVLVLFPVLLLLLPFVLQTNWCPVEANLMSVLFKAVPHLPIARMFVCQPSPRLVLVDYTVMVLVDFTLWCFVDFYLLVLFFVYSSM